MKQRRLACAAVACSVLLTGCGVFAAPGEKQQSAEGALLAQVDNKVKTPAAAAVEHSSAAMAQEQAEAEARPITAAAEEPENLLPVEDGDPDSMQQYREYSYYDPQWVPDEALFGVWDSEKGTWLPQIIPSGKGSKDRVAEGPLLKYDLEKYAETMRPIEEAAKQGDYAACKTLLLDHYKEKYALMSPMQGSSTRSSEIGAQTLMYNLAGYSNGTDKPIEFLSVGAQPGWCQSDITDAVTAVGASADTHKGILALLVALQRDGARAVFDSSETANKPYVEVELSDGTKRRFEAGFDAGMSAGANMAKLYGTAQTLEVEESRSSIDVTENVDEGTSRVYIRFDMDNLTPQEEVRRATLNLYGSHNGSDQSYQKQVCVYKTGYNNTQNESTFCWNSVEHYIMSDDGEDGFAFTDTKYLNGKFVDTVYRAPARASGAIGDSISRYLATDNEEYAYHALRTLLDLCMKRGMLGAAEDTGTYWPYSTKLCLGNRGQIYQNRLRGLIGSRYMTPEVFTCLLKLAWTTGEQLEYCWNSQETGSNWGDTQAAALFNMSLYFDEFEDCHKPLSDEDLLPGGQGKSGGWRELAAYRLVLKAEENIFPDDSCKEIPMGYTDYALSGLINAYNMAKNAGMDDEFPQEIFSSMARTIRYMIFTSAPDGSGWSQGNGKEHTASMPLTRAQWIKNMTDDEVIKWYGSGRKDGSAPDETSMIYPIGNKFVTRGGWNDEAVGSHFNADGACNVHGHADDLSLDVFGFGEHLLVDNGVVDYTDNSVRAWQISTRAHNTIEINGVGQKAPKWTLSSIKDDPFGEWDGKLYLPDYEGGAADEYGRSLSPGYFMNGECNDGYDYVRGGTENYKGRTIAAKNLKWNDYTYERSVFFVRPSFYLVTDYLDPLTDKTEVNTYEQRWHTLPGVSVSIDSETGIASTAGQNASVMIVPVQQADPVEASVGRGYYSNKEGSSVETQHAKYTKTVAGATAMNTLIYPVAPGKHYDITAQNLSLSVPESKASAFSAVIADLDLGNVQEITKYEKHTGRENAETLAFGDYITDGYLAFTEKTNGKLTAAALQGGACLRDKARNYLIKSENKVEGLSVSWSGLYGSTISLDTGKTVVYDKADVDTENEIDLTKLTVYAPESVSAVELNGEEISFRRSGNYLYFGNEPVIDDGGTPEPTAAPEPTATRRPGGTGSHGSSGGGGSAIPAVTPAPTATADPLPTQEPGRQDNLKRELAGHWAETEISALLDQGIVKGDGGTLNLGGEISRAEFLALLIRALGLEESPYQGGAADVAPEDWYAGIIQTALDRGLAQGGGGFLRPEAPVTREEMAKMLVSACVSIGIEAEDHGVGFTDGEAISEWAREPVAKAVQLGLINGFEDGSFQPGAHTLREQAMAVIFRLLELVQT